MSRAWLPLVLAAGACTVRASFPDVPADAALPPPADAGASDGTPPATCGEAGLSCCAGGACAPSLVCGAGTCASCVVQLTAGRAHTCALLADATVRCWGSNEAGQLGDGTDVDRSTPVGVIEGGAAFAGVTSLARTGGDLATCARKADGTAWCWGENTSGQLGDGTTSSSPEPVQVLVAPGTPLAGVTEVAVGEHHACARQDDGTAWCWGANDYGQLGDGTTVSSLAPVQVRVAPGGVPLGGVSAIATSYGHTCARRNGGSLWCWGLNEAGQLGDGTEVDRPAPVAVVGSEGLPVTGAVSLSSAYAHTCASLADGRVLCWGANDHGQLGDGTSSSRSTAGRVLAAAAGPPLADITDVAAGDQHSCALARDGAVWCWGSNVEGQLGIDDRVIGAVAIPWRVGGAAGPLAGADAMTVGNAHSCARTPAGVRCWGWNDSGAVGDGTWILRPAPAQVALECP